MSELLGITVGDLVATMKERRVRIPSEIGAFVALEVCESLIGGPAAVKLGDVRIADDGTISVFAPPGSATSEEAARSVVSLLGALLVAAGTGVPRVLVGLLEEGPSSGRWDLPSLRDDLEASLVPLNRAAARRVLSRMLREVRKPRSNAPSRPAPAASPPGDASLDDELDALLGGSGAGPAGAPEPPASPVASAPAEPASGGGDPGFDDLDAALDATIDELSMPGGPPSERPADRPAPAADAPPLDDVPADDATLADDARPFEDEPMPGRAHPSDAPTRDVPVDRPEPAAPPSGGDDLESLGAELDAKPKGSLLPWLLALVAIVTATAAALALMRPDLVDSMLGRPPPPPPPEGPTAEDREREMRELRGQWGTLTVRAVPAESQILLYVGRGPAVAEELPLGVAHEFVAIADGRRPTRAVLPADAEWEEGEDGMRYELAMQAGEEPMEASELVLGDTRLPRDVGAPSTTLGDVRVITNPPGAKVYLLVGFSPAVTVENVRTEEAVELLVYHEEHPIERVVVGPSDWEQGPDGAKTASVSVTLEGAEEAEE